MFFMSTSSQKTVKVLGILPFLGQALKPRDFNDIDNIYHMSNFKELRSEKTRSLEIQCGVGPQAARDVN